MLLSRARLPAPSSFAAAPAAAASAAANRRRCRGHSLSSSSSSSSLSPFLSRSLSRSLSLSPLLLSSCARRGARRFASAAKSPPVSAAASSLASSALSALLSSKTAALLAGAAVALGVVSFSSSSSSSASSSRGHRFFFSRPVEKAWSKQVEKTLSEPAVPEPEGIAGVYGSISSSASEGERKKKGGGAGAAAPAAVAPTTTPRRTLIPRPRAAAALARALDPDDAGAFFYVVSGPTGCGKTTLVRQALRDHIERAKGRPSSPEAAAAASWSEEEKEKDSTSSSSSSSSPLPFGGAVYVDAASSFPLDFGRDLASAIGFTFEEGVRAADRITKAFTGGGARALLSADPDGAGAVTSSPQARRDSLARAAAALEEAARAAAAAGRGRPLVVVDGADRLAALDPDAFLDLARIAARWTSSSSSAASSAKGSGGGSAAAPVVALVIGDPAALALLRASPSGSRALEPPIAVPGPTDDEARGFLALRGVPEEEEEEGDLSSPSSSSSSSSSSPPSPSSPQAAILEAARGDWLSLEKAARLVRSRAPGVSAGDAAAAAAAELVAGPAGRRFAAAGLLDDTPQQLAGLAAVRALCMLRSGRTGNGGAGKSSLASTTTTAAMATAPSSPPSPSLPPSLWRRCVPKKELQRALLLSDPPSAMPAAERPPPGVWSPLRFDEGGAGLSFASAADEAFACSLSLGERKAGGAAGGERKGANRRGPLLLRCLGGKRAWEAAGERAAEVFLEEAAEEREEEEEEKVDRGSGESSRSSSSSSSSSGIGSLPELGGDKEGGDGAARKAEAPSPVPPTAGTEA